MSSLRDTVKSPPSFLCSGEADVGQEDLLHIEHMIKSLGGKFISCKNEQFISSCSHILCFQFQAYVKIMGGLASGKWLVDKNYIEESFKAGKWLPEEEFEVKNYHELAKFHRLRNRPLYDGSVFYIHMKDPTMSKRFLRVLVAGGAIVASQNDLLKSGYRVENAISDAESYETVQTLVGKHTPILKLDFIKETIFFKHNPLDKRKFLFNPECVPCRKGEILNDPKKYQFMSNFKPVEDKSSPAKARMRHRTKTSLIPFTRGKYSNIAGYFIKKEGRLPPRDGAPVKLPTVDYSSSEVEYLGEVNTLTKEAECIVIDDVSSETRKALSDSRSAVLPSPDSNFNSSDVALKGKHLSPQPCSSTQILREVQDNVENIQDSLVNKLKIHSKVSPIANKNQTIFSGIQRKEPSQSIYMKNKEKVLKSQSATVHVDFERMRKIGSTYCIQMNASYCYLGFNHIPVYQDPVGPRPIAELRPDESLYTSALDEESICIRSKKIGRYKVNVIEKKSGVNKDFSFDDHLYIVASLEWLQLRIQPDVLPNSSTLGLMIQKHILNCSLQDVSNFALGIFESVIFLHPPSTKRMRDFYLSVFNKASQNDSIALHSPPNGWSFLGPLLRSLVTGCSGVFHNLQSLTNSIIHLLELDLVHYNKWPMTVTYLLSYRIFWIGVNQNPSILNSAVKDFINIWIQSADANRIVRRKITKLFSIFLEMVWKWSGVGDPFILTKWPLNQSWMPIVGHILSCFKGLENPGQIMTLIQTLRVPWQQMLLTSIALRSLSCYSVDLHLNFSSLKQFLEMEVNRCRAAGEETELQKNVGSHVIRTRIISFLILSFSHGVGFKFCKSSLIRQFDISLKNKDVLRSCQNDSLENPNPMTSSPSLNPTPPIHGLQSTPVSGYALGAEKSKSSLTDHDSKTIPVEEICPDLKTMVDEIMNLFRIIPCYANEFSKLKRKCSHVFKGSL